jgi:hypothetical protein
MWLSLVPGLTPRATSGRSPRGLNRAARIACQRPVLLKKFWKKLEKEFPEVVAFG